MCTVSFISNKDSFIITSNRDEKTIRPKAIAPQTYAINSKKVFFPKDPQAGGTWYAVNENGVVLVLLNGAAEKHEPNAKYNYSRGLMVLDVIGNDMPLSYWETVILENVEPFTLVLFFESNLYQLRWDGKQKETKKLSIHHNYIWSSSTLYPKEIRDKRETWFTHFLEDQTDIQAEDMIYFHQHTENTDTENGLIINRDAKMITQSITQTVVTQNKLDCLHIDLIDHKNYQNKILLL